MKSTRDGYGDALVELGEKNGNVVVLCADMAESTRVNKFAEKFPLRFIEVGIAEQNMAGIAAGLALSGKVPFISSFAAFSPTGNWLQIRLSICYSNANVKLAGSHTGLTASADGPTQQCDEDIALMRVLPNMCVIDPIDYTQTKKAVFAAAETKGPVYIRLAREGTPAITNPKTEFAIGKAEVLQEGKSMTIISCGPATYEAMLAALELKKHHNIEAEVIGSPCIKPLDNETIIKSAKKTGRVITVEDHQIAGGLGSAVAELLSGKLPCKIVRIGIKDTFTQSGTYAELKDKYGISAHHIVKAALQF